MNSAMILEKICSLNVPKSCSFSHAHRLHTLVFVVWIIKVTVLSVVGPLQMANFKWDDTTLRYVLDFVMGDQNTLIKGQCTHYPHIWVALP